MKYMLIGIIGSPNSGKSTLFKALTLADVEIANYPFTTIKANQGVGYVSVDCPCRKLDVACNSQNSKCISGKRMVPVRLLDVAGLVPEAHKGKGLGNQFLDDLRQGDALIHVLDVSGETNMEGKQEKGFDPRATIEMLENEIDHWIFSILEKNLEKLKRTSGAEKIPLEKLLVRQLSGLGIGEEVVSSALKKFPPESIEFASELRKESKPILIAANKIDKQEASENFEKMKGEYEHITPCSAESELALREAEKKGLISYIPGDSSFEIKGELNEKQKQALEFIRNNVLEKHGSTGVQQAINKTIFTLLGLVAVYPVASINKLADSKGNILPDVFLVREGLPLKEFAEKIHKDLAENFIGGLNLNKQKIGADYPLQDGDVVEILFKK
jgi:ribosome-binding ATPase YchF (GTP1/OBG family)